jgi:Uma2 family endonuclease
MTAMTTASSWLPEVGPVTPADLDRMPDDGRRYELIDGVLVVSPAPRPRHQRAVLRLVRILDDACPPELEVFVAPLDVVLAEDTVMRPDILVGRRADLTDRNLPAAPVLAVEVLSPSTRRFDLVLKRARLEAAGCAHYWVVDPDEPSVLAWRRVGDHYAEAGRATGDEVLRLAEPYPVAVRPADLVADRRVR